MNITVTGMYRVCNKYNFFTHGSNYQYKKLFETVREDSEDLSKIATIIC